MNVFSIKDLENFSGIKAHTIRIWEKRYNLLDPDRTDSNIRTYNENELKKILNVAFLNRNGMKISRIARLTDDELNREVISFSSRDESTNRNFQPGKILMSAFRFDELRFKEALEPFLKNHTIEESYIMFFHPLLEKSRILWQTGSLSRAQEQFVRNSIRQMLVVEDNRLTLTPAGKKASVAMINTYGNLSDNNFLFYKYVLKRRGYDVIYTGGILPASEITEIHKIKPFEYLVVNSGAFDFSRIKIGYFNSIGKSLFIKKIILTDFLEIKEKKIPENIIITRNPEDFLKAINNLE